VTRRERKINFALSNQKSLIKEEKIKKGSSSQISGTSDLLITNESKEEEINIEDSHPSIQELLIDESESI
jgi:hypothetical protein